MVLKTRGNLAARLVFGDNSHESNMVYHREFFWFRAFAG